MAHPLIVRDTQITIRIEDPQRALRRSLTEAQFKLLLDCAQAGLSDFEAHSDDDALTAGEITAIIADLRGGVK